MKVLHFCLLVFILFLFSCSSSMEGGPTYDPCAYKSYQVSGYTLYTLRLNPANQIWLPHLYQTQKPVFSKVGTQAAFTFTQSPFNKSSYQVSVVTRKDSDTYCQKAYTIYDNVNCEYEEFSYTGSPAGKLDITVSRASYPGKFTLGPVFDSANFFNSTETLKINFATLIFEFDPNKFSETNAQKFHENLSLGSNQYENVYEFWKPLADTITIVPQGVFYTQADGIIGFYLTQKQELWVKK